VRQIDLAVFYVLKVSLKTVLNTKTTTGIPEASTCHLQTLPPSKKRLPATRPHQARLP
jgi:hypothetical protein